MGNKLEIYLTLFLYTEQDILISGIGSAQCSLRNIGASLHSVTTVLIGWMSRQASTKLYRKASSHLYVDSPQGFRMYMRIIIHQALVQFSANFHSKFGLIYCICLVREYTSLFCSYIRWKSTGTWERDIRTSCEVRIGNVDISASKSYANCLVVHLLLQHLTECAPSI